MATPFPLGSQKSDQTYWPSIGGVHKSITGHTLIDVGYSRPEGWEHGARIMLTDEQRERLIETLIALR
jgi:hypothetical protein